MPSREQRKKLLEAGRCGACGRDKHGTKTVCDYCLQRHNDRDKEKRKERIQKKLCTTCGNRAPIFNRKTCQECLDKHKSWLNKNQKDNKGYMISNKLKSSRQRKDRKQKVIDHYGGKCLCCGEIGLLFLTIDHINENGAEHRRQIAPNFNSRVPGGDHFYRWLEKNDFPDGFQTLCYNCNIGKHKNSGLCPHKQINSGV